jgi:hypothetical protein
LFVINYCLQYNSKIAEKAALELKNKYHHHLAANQDIEGALLYWVVVHVGLWKMFYHKIDML